jgi:hypothetical protein
MAEISPLRRRMIDDMMIRNLSPATQQSYLYAVAKFSRHFGRSPDRLGLEEVRAYQLHLIAQHRSWLSEQQRKPILGQLPRSTLPTCCTQRSLSRSKHRRPRSWPRGSSQPSERTLGWWPTVADRSLATPMQGSIVNGLLTAGPSIRPSTWTWQRTAEGSDAFCIGRCWIYSGNKVSGQRSPKSFCRTPQVCGFTKRWGSRRSVPIKTLALSLGAGMTLAIGVWA